MNLNTTSRLQAAALARQLTAPPPVSAMLVRFDQERSDKGTSQFDGRLIAAALAALLSIPIAGSLYRAHQTPLASDRKLVQGLADWADLVAHNLNPNLRAGPSPQEPQDRK